MHEKAIKGTKAGQKDGLPLRNLLEKILPPLEEGESLRSLTSMMKKKKF